MTNKEERKKMLKMMRTEEKIDTPVMVTVPCFMKSNKVYFEVDFCFISFILMACFIGFNGRVGWNSGACFINHKVYMMRNVFEVL